MTETPSSDVLDESDAGIDREDASTLELPEGLDSAALDAVGIDAAVALLAGAVGVAAWELPRTWLFIVTFAIAGICVMFAEDWRVRAVGPLVLAGILAPLVSYGAVAILIAAGVMAVIAALYHHGLVDVAEVI